MAQTHPFVQPYQDFMPRESLAVDHKGLAVDHHALAVDHTVLVLNQNYEPLNICALRRGLILLHLGKADVLRFSHRNFHTVTATWPIPSVLRLTRYVRRPQPELRISRRSVFARDGYLCQYCGGHGSLTIDHVVPRHRGGLTTWDNVVCCCLRCNNKKGNRTPHEAGMSLPHSPRRPRVVPFVSYPRFVSAVHNPEWHEFLSSYADIRL